MKKVSIILVNYNCAQDTAETLASIAKISYSNFEVIVVDNGSSNDDLKLIEAQFPKTIFIYSEKNLGFAGGNNLGINVATGEYIFLLNADTILPNHTLKRLVKTLDFNPKVAAVSPKIKYYHNPDLIQYAGSTPMSKITTQNEYIGHQLTDSKVFSKVEKTAFTHGAAMLVRSTVVKEIGPMQEEYFLYYEELDWCERMKNAGYDLMYNGTVSILHKASVTTNKISGLKHFYLNRNRILFVKNTYKRGTIKVLAIAYLYLVVFLKNIFKNLLNPPVLRASVNAVKWNIIN